MKTLKEELAEQLNLLADITPEELKQKPHIIQSVRNLLLNGAHVDTKNKNGDTYLHLLAASPALKEFMKAEREKSGNELTELVLDIPIVISWFKPNPFVTNNQGFTPSFMAAFYQDMPAHGMLASYENVYQSRTISQTLYSMSQMNILAQYHNSSYNGIFMSNQQDPEFFKHHDIVARNCRRLNGYKGLERGE